MADTPLLIIGNTVAAAVAATLDPDELDQQACRWIVAHPDDMARVARCSGAPCYVATGPAMAAVATLLRADCDPAANLTLLVSYVRREVAPNAKLATDAALASDLAWARGLSIATGRGAGERDRAPDLGGRVPARTARRRQQDRRRAKAEGQMQLHGVGLDSRPAWMPEPTRERDQYDPAANRPIGFPESVPMAEGAA